jgi:predicted transglutaminase-like cysteine proteinase
MAIFHPGLRSVSLSRKYTTAIGWIVAAAGIVAMPSEGRAQSAFPPANAWSMQGCDGQPAVAPVQLAMAPLGKIEPSAGPRSASKSEAILGGRMSKLEQMRLAQASVGSGAATVEADMVATAAVGARDDCGDAGAILPQSQAVQPMAMPANAILGSMSIAIARTPFDLKWAAVSSGRGRAKIDRLLTATGARRSNSQSGQVEAVNRWVNRNIQFGEDRDIYGRPDYWATAGETFRRGIGDCEDFAIAKMELLAALGISRDRMRLVVARDLVRNADHAILVVTLPDGAVMLDNMTDRLLDARLPNDYRPIMSFSQNNKFVHGYSVQPARPVRMASASIVASPAALNVGDVSAVTVEPEMPILSMALLSVPLVLPNGLSARA